jgi:hypothetical protein
MNNKIETVTIDVDEIDREDEASGTKTFMVRRKRSWPSLTNCDNTGEGF